MLTRADLRQHFPGLRDIGGGILKCQDVVPAFTISYYLRLSGTAAAADLMMVSQGREDDGLALLAMGALSDVAVPRGLSFHLIPAGNHRFTKLLLVAPDHHRWWKERLDEHQREQLVFCAPVYSSEFSGGESAEVFWEMCDRFVPVLDWSREAHPKILLRFDDRRTRAGTGEGYVLAKLERVLQQIDLLRSEDENGGFIELLNYRDVVLEILPHEDGRFWMIRDRNDRDRLLVTRQVLVSELRKFLTE